MKEAQIQFESISKKIADKKDYLSALEEKITELEENYNRKIEENATLEDQLKITRESKEALDQEYKELLKNNEELVKTYENRQVDLIVLTDSIKEKVGTQEDIRAKISKLNKEVEEREKNIIKQREEAEIIEKKLKDMGFKTHIGEHDFVYDWGKIVDSSEVINFVDKIQSNLKGAGTIIKITTIR